MSLEETFGKLFEFLKEVDYSWGPQTPDQLRKSRENPENFNALVKYFGLGLSVSWDDFINEGASEGLIQQVSALWPAVSKCGSYFIPHHHWSHQSKKLEDYIYFG